VSWRDVSSYHQSDIQPPSLTCGVRPLRHAVPAYTSAADDELAAHAGFFTSKAWAFVTGNIGSSRAQCLHKSPAMGWLFFSRTFRGLSRWRAYIVVDDVDVSIGKSRARREGSTARGCRGVRDVFVIPTTTDFALPIRRLALDISMDVARD
jgi:hypothetical protein